MNDRLRWRWLFVAFTSISLGIASYYFFAAPRTLRIVVGPENSAQFRYVRAIAEAFADTRQPFRLNVMVTPGSADSSAALDAKRADLGVLRSDDLTSNDAQSVVILQRQAVIVLIRNDSELKSLDNLRGRSLSVVATGAAPNKPLIERLLSHYGIGANEVILEEMSAPDAAKSLMEGRVDALILVASPASQRARRLIGELTEGSRLQTALTGLAGSNALAPLWQFRFTSSGEAFFTVGASPG